MTEAHIPEHIAGVEPQVAFSENITEYFFLRLFFVRITGEWRFLRNFHDQKPCLTPAYFLHKTLFISHGRVVFGIIGHQGKRSHAGAHAVVDVRKLVKTPTPSAAP